jgi:hypothetical protein
MRTVPRFRLRLFATTITFAVTLAAHVAPVTASELVSLQQLTDRVLLLHFDDGQVQHHQRGHKRSDERVLVDRLDVAAATSAKSYSISSADDAAYATPKQPTSIGRKTKGTDWAWFVDKWENNRAVNERPDHADEHWLYLTLPTPLQRGKTYTVNTGTLAKNGRTWRLTFNETNGRSEAVHVNLLGYVPSAPQKFAYVYHWMGDQGSLRLKSYEGRSFRVVNTKTGQTALRGTLRFRMGKENAETFHTSDSPPWGNFLNADVWECDFSALKQPGTYIVAVDGIGSSFPFQVNATSIASFSRHSTRPLSQSLWHCADQALYRVRAPGSAQPAAHAGIRRKADLYNGALAGVGLRRWRRNQVDGGIKGTVEKRLGLVSRCRRLGRILQSLACGAGTLVRF